MRILETAIISDSKRFPIKKGTLKFLQDSHTETLANSLIGLIGPTYNGLTCYILWGCVNSGSGLVYSITPGAIFFLGEVFTVAAAAFTSPGGEVAVLNITTTQYTTDADPVTFSDATSNNVHNVRAITIASAVAGTGIANYSAVNFYDFTRAVAEAALQAQITAINAAWTSATAAVTYTNGTATTNASPIEYKIIGKTMHLSGAINFTTTSVSSGNTMYWGFTLPSSAVKGVAAYEQYVNILNVTDGTYGVIRNRISAGSSSISFGGSENEPDILNGKQYQVGFNISFEIA